MFPYGHKPNGSFYLPAGSYNDVTAETQWVGPMGSNGLPNISVATTEHGIYAKNGSKLVTDVDGFGIYSLHGNYRVTFGV